MAISISHSGNYGSTSTGSSPSGSAVAAALSGSGTGTSQSSSKSNGNFSGGDTQNSSGLSNMQQAIRGINNKSNDSGSSSGSTSSSSPFSVGHGQSISAGTTFTDGTTTYTYNGSSATPTNTSTTKTLTVDDVWSTGAPSNRGTYSDSQGDYAASGNEKSNISTSTFGNQASIETSPTLISENKGLVNNQAIDAVPGLVTQQKDKESQDVLDARKSRDEAEAEDKTQSMRDKIRNINKEAQNEENVLDFTIGKEANKAEQKALDKATADVNQELSKQGFKTTDEALQHYDDVSKEMSRLNQAYQDRQDQFNVDYAQVKEAKEALTASGVTTTTPEQTYTLSDGSVVGTCMVPSMGTAGMKNMATYTKQKEAIEAYNKAVLNAVQADKTAKEAYDAMNEYDKNTFQPTKKNAEKLNGLMAAQTRAQENFDKSFVSETPKAEVTETREETPAKTDTLNTKTSLEQEAEALRSKYLEDPEAEKAASKLEALSEVQKSLEEATNQLTEEGGIENASDATIAAWVEAQKQYNKNLQDALRGNPFAQTDWNTEFTEAVAKANDFEVTLPDGTKTTYSAIATAVAEQSPRAAAAMYRHAAETYEAEGHPVLAKLASWKAEISQNWLGSKVTFADNQVRSQFIDMADVNMRATYATYNNVLRPGSNASEEQRADAYSQITQAQQLKSAAAALKASTGFFSSIGDSVSDGSLGVTDPGKLNTAQQIMVQVKNVCQIVLGLGVSPAANKAYQNIYYTNKSYLEPGASLLSKDFDKDGFAWVEEYGNNAAAGMIGAGTELTTGLALCFNPATVANGIDLIVDSVKLSLQSAYGVRKGAEKAQSATSVLLSYYHEAEQIASDSGLGDDVTGAIGDAITQIENFELKADEVGNIDSWLEGSGSNTASNEKFNQSLTYDEWLKLIESDETMKQYAKKLVENA